MSAQAQSFTTAPSDKDTPTQDRGIFNSEAQKHQSHHYLRMYGGQAVQAAMWGFGATLGADAANAVVGDAKACRFHFYYDIMSEHIERILVNTDEDNFIGTEVARSAPISLKKAFWIFWEQRRQTFCESCHPFVIPDTNIYQRCHCTLFDHFVGHRWLCLPCFFLEETRAAHVKYWRVCGYEPGGPGGDGARPGYVSEDMCDCGKPAMDKSDEMCRVCNGDKGKAVILPKILAQLG
ncbi:hypothetical protein LTR36_000954 [Oleoguttula mirabilis]|uniref:Uncharacterized protein n=1 Tax=Oleoguttula mirabilis TaxID=1507867 RepID=A0AAV9JPH7_9PEZI|nr:hypothetical protein LTR36_000954 [Oleoguttula mirabilis]